MSAWMQHAIRYVQAAGRRTDSAGGAATAAATAALAEQVGRLADVAEAWQKAQEPHVMRFPSESQSQEDRVSVTKWALLDDPTEEGR